MAKLEEKPAGTCPACGELVFNSRETDGPVWTCPADLATDNPFWEPPLHGKSDEEWEREQEKVGVYSFCMEDFGGSCYERLPLHSACYDRGDY